MAMADGHVTVQRRRYAEPPCAASRCGCGIGFRDGRSKASRGPARSEPCCFNPASVREAGARRGARPAGPGQCGVPGPVLSVLCVYLCICVCVFVRVCVCAFIF